MNVIIPAAGRSTRYKTPRPKYLLTMPDGKLMFEFIADQYVDRGDSVTFIIVKEHVEKFSAETAIRSVYGDTVNIVILDDFTSGPAETIRLALDNINGPLLCHDCDSFVEYQPDSLNFVATRNLNDSESIDSPAKKSYIIEEDGVIVDIVEKQIVSNTFCTGVYGFESTQIFIDAYTSVKQTIQREIFISDVIRYLLTQGVHYTNANSHTHIDLGTYEAFVAYQKSNTTIFCDLDGTVFVNQSKHFGNPYTTAPVVIPEAVEYLLSKQNNGSKIYFTTSRPASAKKLTEDALDIAGFSNYEVIYNIPHAPRMLINDYALTNPYPSAISINVPRDNGDNWKMLP